MSNIRTVKGAGGVVFNPKGEVLVLGHRNGDWVFPKGHIDPGETKLEAALREVEEEAGIKAHCPDPDFSYTSRYFNDVGDERIIIWYPMVTTATEPILEEALFPHGAFLSVAAALKRLSFVQDRDLLQVMGNWWRVHVESPTS